ncbi:MAG: hypothetical protein KBD01_05250 [Acidobacteria bacterium]|nr:hypothetical protein [Acidobacteriota bacterium]
MSVRGIIEALNNLTIGEISSLGRRMDEIRDEVREIGLAEVSAILDQAMESLAVGDLKAFRKRVQHAVSRLGHARAGTVGDRSR